MTDFFEKIKKNINKGVSTINVKSKELIDSSKVKGEISKFKSKKINSLVELGNIVFKLNKENAYENEEIKNKCIEIDEIIKTIKIKEDELEQIRVKAKESLKVNEPDSFCKKCGEKVFVDTKFCRKCGTPVKELGAAM